MFAWGVRKQSGKCGAGGIGVLNSTWVPTGIWGLSSGVDRRLRKYMYRRPLGT